MLRRLFGWAFATTGFLWLRPRWKWLASCVGFVLLAEYLHGEYVEYILLLAPVRGGDAIVGPLSAAFALKNGAIVVLVVVYACFEIWLAKRRRQGTKKIEGGSRKRAVSASNGDNPHQNGERSEARDDQDEPPPASPDTDDGFDFLRHGRKLRTRSEKIMERK